MFVFDAKLVQVNLELLSEHFHGSHISKQDSFHHSLSDELDLCWLEFAREEVILVAVEQLDRGGGMQVFLHVVFSVHLEQRRLGNDMVPVVVAVVGDIVAQSRHDEGKSVQVSEVSSFNHALIVQNYIDVLGHI